VTRGGVARSALLSGVLMLAAAAWTSLRAATREPSFAAPCVVDVPRHRVDLACAGVDEIALLPGVGPSLAARIVADRAAHGAFASVEALSRVPGVGVATLEAVRDEIRIDTADAVGPSRAHRGGR
jgi:competence ComEA-like helix-hairpin-helix protein